MKQTSIKRVWMAGLVLALTGVFSGGAMAGITLTKHNLSTSHPGSATIYGDKTEICIFCHTPHDAFKNANIPLWNKRLSEVASYGIYTSLTMNATDVTNVGVGTVVANATVTNLCLSCHDGTVAINSFYNPSNLETVPTMTGTTGGLLPAGNSNLGTDLTNDHPVNFTYDATLVSADQASNGGIQGLKDPTTLTGVRLYSNKVQCASCHDPHTSEQGAFLRVTMAGSALCFSCHSK